MSVHWISLLDCIFKAISVWAYAICSKHLILEFPKGSFTSQKNVGSLFSKGIVQKCYQHYQWLISRLFAPSRSRGQPFKLLPSELNILNEASCFFFFLKDQLFLRDQYDKGTFKIKQTDFLTGKTGHQPKVKICLINVPNVRGILANCEHSFVEQFAIACKCQFAKRPDAITNDMVCLFQLFHNSTHLPSSILRGTNKGSNFFVFNNFLGNDTKF